MKAIETTTPAAAPVTNEARLWTLIKEAAELGFRLQEANELEGMTIDRRDGRSIEARELRLVDYRRAAAVNRAWNPDAGEIPRRTP